MHAFESRSHAPRDHSAPTLSERRRASWRVGTTRFSSDTRPLDPGRPLSFSGHRMPAPDPRPTVRLYDTTLRDGTQREGLSLSVEDKVKIARMLDRLGVHYIEGGWPGSNPKDAEFFRRMHEAPPARARIAAFG